MNTPLKELPKVYVSLTGWDYPSFLSKLEEIKKLGITEACVFLTTMPPEKHQEFFKELLTSGIKYIPLVHLREENTSQDIEFFKKNYDTEYFVIHDMLLDRLEQFEPYLKNLFLENHVRTPVNKLGLEKLGGFCIDLNHLQTAKRLNNPEYEQVMEYKDTDKFKCNHLSGYREGAKGHEIETENDFEYIKELPNFVLGEVIAIELMDSIETQLKMKKHAEDIIKEKLSLSNN